MNEKLRKEVVAVLQQQGRGDLARQIAAAPPKSAAVRKTWTTLFRQDKQLQSSGNVLEKQTGASIASLLQKIRQHIDTLDRAGI
jgi:hypothetical protein